MVELQQFYLHHKEKKAISTVGEILATPFLAIKEAISYKSVVSIAKEQVEALEKDYIYKNDNPCTKAYFGVNGDIMRGKRLTIGESVIHITKGGNVMCDDFYSANMVAVAFPKRVGPEIDKNQLPGKKYYYHFHPDRYSHRHIWFRN